jgi:hypothetical protein
MPAPLSGERASIYSVVSTLESVVEFLGLGASAEFYEL